MIRRLFALALAATAVWLLRRLLAGRAEPPRRGRPPTMSPASTGVLVRDRVCNTFLPREKALRVRRAGADHYFCSDRCRSQWLEGSAGNAG